MKRLVLKIDQKLI